MSTTARRTTRTRPAWPRCGLAALALLLATLPGAPAAAQTTPAAAPTRDVLIPDATTLLPPAQGPERVSASLQILLLLTVLSLAPAILVMMTSFTRVVVVLGLLRQALATQQLPPNQVIIGLSLFLTFMVMAPVWQEINTTALTPYLSGGLSQADALERAAAPIRAFMIRQIQINKSEEDVFLFLDYRGLDQVAVWKDVPTSILIPAFILSELKKAFFIGFVLYLPFLIVDMVTASVLISMGMLMLPPVLISLPFKILLFVLVDGWHLVVGSLLQSFG
jgi:flagellar biosynthetic protein FliP